MSFAVVGGATIAAAGGIYSASKSSSAAGEAADKQSAAADKANQLQLQMFNQQRADHEPWRQAGIVGMYGSGGILKRVGGGAGGYQDPGALNANKEKFIQDKIAAAQKSIESQLSGLNGPQRAAFEDKIRSQYNDDYMRTEAEKAWAASPEAQQQDTGQYEIDPELTRKFTNDDFVKDPGYDFRMKEGQKALERSAAARGGLNGGAQMKALSRYGQDYASNEYGNAYNRFTNDQTNRFNRLSAVSGLGQAAASQMGQAGQNYANQVGQNMMGSANAQAASGIAGANAWGGALSNIGQSAMGVVANNQQQKWMDKVLSAQSSNKLSTNGTAMAGEPVNLSALYKT
jgi:hypothetical protein